MCVIIYRKPGISIPHEKLESACKVNADGMGLLAFDRGKLELRKHFEPKGNDPDTLARFFEDTKDLHVYAHLRFRTKGATDKDNVHPFGVLKTKKHGMDLQFMHNGTLSDYGTDSICDSKDFTKKLLTPLCEKLLKAVGPEEVTLDPTLLAILEKYAGRGSVFLLADSLGNHQIVNYTVGKEFDGWWASNEYSFNRFHRTSYTGGAWEWDAKQQDYTRRPVQPKTNTVSLAAVPTGTGAAKPPFDDEIPFNTEATNDKAEVAKKPTTTPTVPTNTKARERFIDVAGITGLADVCGLSYAQIQDLVDEYPEEAAMLIRDLIKELWDHDVNDNDENEYDFSQMYGKAEAA